MLKKNTYEKINGFSNKYYGWGGEDHDIQKRAEVINIKINRNNFIKRGKKHKIYDDWSEEKINTPNNKSNQSIKYVLKELYKKDKKNIYKDGLNNCEYKIINIKNYKNNKNMKRILVDV